MVDVDTVIMYPRLAFTLTAHTITPRPDGMRVSRPQPFLEAAAQAMGIDRLNVIETGVDPLTAPRQQWDDGGNALAIDRRVVVSHERNVETNSRLEAAGIKSSGCPPVSLAAAAAARGAWPARWRGTRQRHRTRACPPRSSPDRACSCRTRP